MKERWRRGGGGGGWLVLGRGVGSKTGGGDRDGTKRVHGGRKE